MPRGFSEVTSGAQFSRSSQEGASSDAQTRAFKVLLNYAGEVIDVQGTCGIYIGYQHPYNTNIYCASFDARYDGDSRMVLLCTFNYAPKAGPGLPDPQAVSPDLRPANWSTSIATYESPVRTWRRVYDNGAGGSETAASPLGDMYDGISRLEPIVTISVEQYEPSNPFRNNAVVGCINQEAVVFGNLLTCAPSTLMLRSIQTSPVIESWGNLSYRGWKATYEFLYKKNPTSVSSNAGGYREVEVGWDIAVPQTGFNVKAFAPNAAGATQDIYAQPLKHSQGKIVGPPFLLPDNVTGGDKVRAMVKVFEYENGGASQTPSAQPIPLNDDGTPRHYSASPPVLVYRYRVYKEANFNALNLKLG